MGAVLTEHCTKTVGATLSRETEMFYSFVSSHVLMVILQYSRGVYRQESGDTIGHASGAMIHIYCDVLQIRIQLKTVFGNF